jgi:hypothetical protein
MSTLIYSDLIHENGWSLLKISFFFYFCTPCIQLSLWKLQQYTISQIWRRRRSPDISIYRWMKQWMAKHTYIHKKHEWKWRHRITYFLSTLDISTHVTYNIVRKFYKSEKKSREIINFDRNDFYIPWLSQSSRQCFKMNVYADILWSDSWKWLKFVENKFFFLYILLFVDN